MYCNVSSWFDSQMAAASYYHRCSSPHLVLLLVSSAIVVFICEPCSFQCIFFSFFTASWILCSFNLNLTLFSLLMFKAVMIGCDKRDIFLHPQKKKSDVLSDSCHLPLVMLHSHHVILFLIAFCYVHAVFSPFSTDNVKLILCSSPTP